MSRTRPRRRWRAGGYRSTAVAGPGSRSCRGAPAAAARSWLVAAPSRSFSALHGWGSVTTQIVNSPFNPLLRRRVVLLPVRLVLLRDGRNERVTRVRIRQERRQRQDDLVQREGRRPCVLQELGVSGEASITYVETWSQLASNKISSQMAPVCEMLQWYTFVLKCS